MAINENNKEDAGRESRRNDEVEEDRPKPLTLAPKTWEPFDEARRGALLEAIRSGVRSRRGACGLIGLNRSTLSKWIERGKKLDGIDAEGEPYRKFFADLESAEAYRDSRPEVFLFKAAQENWRAAEALANLQDRRTRNPDARRVAKANADRAEADARYAQLRADALEQERKGIVAHVYFAQEVVDEMNEAEREMLGSFCERKRYSLATQDEIVARENALDPEDARHLRELAEEWGLIQKENRLEDLDGSEPNEE